MSEIERASIERAIIELEVMRREYNRPCGQMQSTVDKNQRRTDIIRLCKSVLRAELEREKNEPLTWKELVSAETTPVYIRNLEYKEESMWAVVGNEYDKIGFTFVNLYDETESDCGCKELYGETWIAYRYESKGEQNV